MKTPVVYFFLGVFCLWIAGLLRAPLPAEYSANVQLRRSEYQRCVNAGGVPSSELTTSGPKLTRCDFPPAAAR